MKISDTVWRRRLAEWGFVWRSRAFCRRTTSSKPGSAFIPKGCNYFKKIIIKYTNCRYIPQLGDHIVGVVTSRVGELYKVDIGSADQAYVSLLPSALSIVLHFFCLPDQFPLVRRRHEAEQTESGRGRRALRADRESLEASRARAQLCRRRTQVQGNGQTRGWIRFQSIFF